MNIFKKKTRTPQEGLDIFFRSMENNRLNKQASHIMRNAYIDSPSLLRTQAFGSALFKTALIPLSAALLMGAANLYKLHTTGGFNPELSANTAIMGGLGMLMLGASSLAFGISTFSIPSGLRPKLQRNAAQQKANNKITPNV